MLIKKIQQFKSLVSIIILLAASIPALVVAIVLITQLSDNNRSQSVREHKLKARLLSQKIEHKLELLVTNIEQLSQEQNIILSTENSVFSNAAHHQMEALVRRNPIITFMQIYDTHNWPAVSFPKHYTFMTFTPLLSTLTKIIKQKELTPQVLIFSHHGIKKVINNYFNDKIFTDDQFIVITTPLFKKAEGLPNQPQVSGVIFALFPIAKFINEMNLSPSQLVSIELESNHKILSQSVLSKQTKWMIESWPFKIGKNKVLLNYGEPESIVTKPINRAIISFSFIVILIISSCIIIVIWITRRLSTPFYKMQKLVNEYAQGNFNVPIPKIRYMEFKELANLLSNMAHTISINREELEYRVEIRTKDLAKSNKELKLTLDKLEEMHEHLVESEKMSLLGKLVAGVAHEINTPIGISITAITTLEEYTHSLSSYVESGKLTRKKMSDFIAQTSQLIPILVNNLNRAAELITNFKEVAVDQSNEKTRDFNLYNYIHEILISLQPQLKRYQISIEIKCDQNITIESFPGAFAQIITNFVINSVCHGFKQEKQYHIVIYAHIAHNQLEFIYTDDGCGIPQNNLNRVFEPFYTTKRNEGGSGLGLSIVHNIVHQKLQGKIKAVDTQQQGVKFIINIPIIIKNNMS